MCFPASVYSNCCMPYPHMVLMIFCPGGRAAKRENTVNVKWWKHGKTVRGGLWGREPCLWLWYSKRRGRNSARCWGCCRCSWSTCSGTSRWTSRRRSSRTKGHTQTLRWKRKKKGVWSISYIYCTYVNNTIKRKWPQYAGFWEEKKKFPPLSDQSRWGSADRCPLCSWRWLYWWFRTLYSEPWQSVKTKPSKKSALIQAGNSRRSHFCVITEKQTLHAANAKVHKRTVFHKFFTVGEKKNLTLFFKSLL